MKKYYFLLILAIKYSILCYGQNYVREKKCNPDTLTFTALEYLNFHHHGYTSDTFKVKAIKCYQVSKLGIILDGGFGQCLYQPKTTAWLGNHTLFNIGIGVAYNNINFGIRAKMWTINPKFKLISKQDTLIKEIILNPNKYEYYLSYSKKLRYNFTFEPQIALSRNVFYVINEDILNKKYNIPSLYGVNTGLTLHKYFQKKQYTFISAFIRANYTAVAFSKINTELGYGFWDWSFGISLKAFNEKVFLERIKP